MINSFSSKILGALTIITLIFGSVAGALLIHTSKANERGVTQRIHSELAQHVVDHYLLFKDGKPDREEAKKTFHDLMILGANFEFYLADKHGAIVSYSAKPGSIKRDQLNLEPIQQFIERDNDKLILGPDPKHEDRNKVFSVAPIYQMGEVYGYLYVVIGSQAHDELASEAWYDHVIESGLALLAVLIIFSLLCGTLIIGYISKPLNVLTQQVKKVKEQGFTRENHEQNQQLLAELGTWPENTDNDIAFLGHSFHETLTELQRQYENVVSIDDLRKELLSHVSHDLRTPLASLLGYLETWEIQHEQLSKEKSREYIATAKNSAQKIATLIEQLFELAHLDGNSVTVRREPVAIAELIQDVLQKFSIIANDQAVALDVSPQDSSIIVRADIEKLERVFTNLVENAIRHTPAGGSISVKIQRDSGFVSIEVSDTGIGIPERDLPHIFDPHYKAGNSVRENTAHGGLGLAITKKLLELHQANISVVSKLNQGTTFRFQLQPDA